MKITYALHPGQCRGCIKRLCFKTRTGTIDRLLTRTKRYLTAAGSSKYFSIYQGKGGDMIVVGINVKRSTQHTDVGFVRMNDKGPAGIFRHFEKGFSGKVYFPFAGSEGEGKTKNGWGVQPYFGTIFQYYFVIQPRRHGERVPGMYCGFGSGIAQLFPLYIQRCGAYVQLPNGGI